MQIWERAERLENELKQRVDPSAKVRVKDSSTSEMCRPFAHRLSSLYNPPLILLLLHRSGKG